MHSILSEISEVVLWRMSILEVASLDNIQSPCLTLTETRLQVEGIGTAFENRLVQDMQALSMMSRLHG